MRNQLLFLMYFLATTESFAGGSSGSGPPMRSIGALENGTSTIGPARQSANCMLNEAQMVFEAQGTNEEIILNSWVISNKSGGSGGSGPPGKFIEAFGGSSGSGPLGKKAEVAALVGSNSLSKLKSFLENNEHLVVGVENRWLEVKSIYYFSDPNRLEIALEDATIRLIAIVENGIAGSGPPAKRRMAINTFDGGSTAGGGTIGDSGTMIGTGGWHPFRSEGGIHSGGGAISGLQIDCTADGGAAGGGGTIGYDGISGGSGVVTEVNGGSGVGSGGWTKEADGIAVGGGSPE